MRPIPCLSALLVLLFTVANTSLAQTSQTQAAGSSPAKMITCSSDGGKVYCDANTHHGVHLVKQRSDAPCKQGTSWDYDGLGIWVDKGCSADFILGDLPQTSAANSGSATLNCASEDGKKKYCPVEDVSARVTLLKQLGPSACVEGTNWGRDPEGIWVDQGCQAQFQVQSAAAVEKPATGDQSCLKRVGKQRSEQMVKQCLQVSPATHPPCNSQNSCELIEDEIRRGCSLLGRDAPGFCGGYK